jgi:CspA family cold shock protein
MTEFGTIKIYDTGNGSGTIVPEKGGDALPFRKSDLQQESQEPKPHQRFGYDVKNADNGKRYAVNLHPQGEAQSQQAPGGSETVRDQASSQQG